MDYIKNNEAVVAVCTPTQSNSNMMPYTCSSRTILCSSRT